MDDDHNQSAQPARRRCALVTSTNAKDPDEALLIEACRKVGVEATMCSWDIALPAGASGPPSLSLDCTRFPLAIIRSTWNYHLYPELFLSWLSQVESHAGCRLLNSPAVVRDNIHKSYLKRFEERGVQIVPTCFVWQKTDCERTVAQLCAQRGWDDIVIKPCVSADSLHAKRFQTKDGFAEPQAFLEALLKLGDVLVQRYMPDILEHGERSYMVIDGELTHCVRRNPKFSGEAHIWKVSTFEPSEAERSFVNAVLAAQPMGESLLFARVDVIRDERDQSLCLTELELIEPCLFLYTAPPAAVDRLAQGIFRRILEF